LLVVGPLVSLSSFRIPLEPPLEISLKGSNRPIRGLDSVGQSQFVNSNCFLLWLRL
jgi:hypothetical protein